MGKETSPVSQGIYKSFQCRLSKALIARTNDTSPG